MPVWVSIVLAIVGAAASLALSLIAWLLRGRVESTEGRVREQDERIRVLEKATAVAQAIDPVTEAHTSSMIGALRSEIREVKVLLLDQNREFAKLHTEITAHISREDSVIDRLEGSVPGPIQTAPNGRNM